MSSQQERRALLPSSNRRRNEEDEEERSSGITGWATALGGVMVLVALVVVGVVCWRDTNMPHPGEPSIPGHRPVGGGAHAHPDANFDHDEITTNVTWRSCGAGYECARFIVPLDYENPAMGTANLSVVKRLATEEPRLGSLFINPGGPGGSGASAVWRLGDTVVRYMGGHYDIIGWDPRGINGSTPLATCFRNASDEVRFLNTLPFESSPPSTLPGSPWDKGELSESDLLRLLEDQSYDQLQTQQWLSHKCRENNPGIWDWMDTGSVARDIVRMADLIDGKGSLINYWGFSYGTALGQYLVNMFPARVGRVIVDGPLDAERWGHQANYQMSEDSFRSSEDGFTAYCTWCAEAKHACPLTKGMKHPTAAKVRERIDKILVELEINPLPVDKEIYGEQMHLKPSAVVGAIFMALYSPLKSFQTNSELLARAFLSDSAAERANASLQLFNMGSNLKEDGPGAKPSFMPYAMFGVECGDTLRGYAGESTDLYDAARLLAAQRWHVQHDISAHFAGTPNTCAAWEAKQGGRAWTGPWNARVPNGQVLVVANQADPICTLYEGRKVFAHFHQDATLIVRPSVGHCSPVEPSLCQNKIIRAWFNDNVPPPRGKEIFCDTPRENPWLVPKVSLAAESAEDVALMEVMEEMARVW